MDGWMDGMMYILGPEMDHLDMARISMLVCPFSSLGRHQEKRNKTFGWGDIKVRI